MVYDVFFKDGHRDFMDEYELKQELAKGTVDYYKILW